MSLTKPNESELGEAGNLDILAKFKTKDLPIDLSNKKIGYDGWTPMHDAIAKQDEALVDQLLATMSQGGTDQGWNTAHIAAQVGNISIAKKIFAASKMNGNSAGWNPFHISVLSDNIEVMDAAFKALKFSPADGNNWGFNALHLAVFANKMESVKYLCKKLPILVERGNEYGWNAAHIAAATGNVEALQYLFTQGIDKSIGNAVGCRLSHIATYYNKPEVLELLKNVYDQNEEHTTSLHIAARMNNLPMVKYCVETLKESKDQKDDTGATALTIAVFSGFGGILQYFLDLDPSHKNDLAKKILNSEEVPQTSIDVAFAGRTDEALDIA